VARATANRLFSYWLNWLTDRALVSIVIHMKNREATSTVGAFDAKTRLSELLDRVEAGEVIVITRHGEPIAKLQRYVDGADKKRARKAIAALRELRRRFLKGQRGMSMDEIKGALTEGRR